MFDDPESDLYQPPPQEEGDIFANAEVPAPGFAGRYYNISWQLCNQESATSDRLPLEMSTSWTHEEMTAMYQALAVVDELAYIAVSIRYRYLGIPIIMCTASMGTPDRGAPRKYEERDSDGWPALVIECHQRALEPLKGPGRKLMEELAKKYMTDLLDELKHREDFREPV